jgi:hypothetical protein
MAGENCTMPGCMNEIEYTGLGVCRLCYHRIYWVSKNYNKSMEGSKAALHDIDAAAIKHGLVSKEDGIYSRRKSLLS